MAQGEILRGDWVGGFFARHETFCPRYGWIKKGFDAVVQDPHVFDAQDDIERLGVGKNMVRSIRFWCLAFHVIEPSHAGAPRRLGGPMRPTPFGRALLSEDGWDPYLEDPGSLWLLHWQLFSPPITAASWPLIFNLPYSGHFSVAELVDALRERLSGRPGAKRCSDSSLAKDVSCLVRMYAPVQGRMQSDEIECPFTHLGLLLSTAQKQTYRFSMGDKRSLPEEVFVAACCDYALKGSDAFGLTNGAASHKGVRSLSLNKAAFGHNSPGVVFKLSESDIGYRLEKVAGRFPEDLHFSEIYGSRQLQFLRSPSEVFRKVLDHYYGTDAGARYLS